LFIRYKYQFAKISSISVLTIAVTTAIIRNVVIELPENLKQTKPLSSTQEAAYLWILTTAEQLKSEVAELFKQKDLTSPQYNVLRILRGAGESGLCGREIGDRMITRDSDITRMLDRLESRGLIRRV